MSRFAHRSISLAAAVCYGVLAVASHGLHGWVGCEDGHCDQAHATAHDCDGCEHHAALASPQETSVRGYAAGHDAANCSVCAWVAKLKTSCFAAASAPIVSEAVVFQPLAKTSFVPAPAPRIFSARGPPAILA